VTFLDPDPLRPRETDLDRIKWLRDPEPHPDSRGVLLAAVIVIVALAILAAVKHG
jgi:hypothetical protein